MEFNPDLRRIDVAADMAFLVMDLARLGAESSAWQLIDAYRRDGGDPGDEPLLSFLASYRAWVRSKVACLRALELEPGDPERGRAEAQARELIGLGHRFAWRARRPLALVVCGVAGTGKTTLARELAAVSGWDHLSSDVTRKRLAGIAPTERAREEHYSREFTRRDLPGTGRSARDELASRHGVIVDATFHRRSERAAFRAGLGDRQPGSCSSSAGPRPTVLEARLRARETEPGRVSDADATVHDDSSAISSRWTRCPQGPRRSFPPMPRRRSWSPRSSASSTPRPRGTVDPHERVRPARRELSDH